LENWNPDQGWAKHEQSVAEAPVHAAPLRVSAFHGKTARADRTNSLTQRVVSFWRHAMRIHGLPTISVPCGFSESGLPIGLQISGNHLSESTVLALAHAYERATDWHKRRPMLS
jgi:Asp-tRNA(Asn)/Glu-tRNA(Gln) amidotransferase A subunit family amidase